MLGIIGPSWVLESADVHTDTLETCTSCDGFCSGRPPLCALQPTQSRRLSEPARLPPAHAACAALPQPVAGTAAGAVPEQQSRRARVDASMMIQAERDLPLDKPGFRADTGTDAHMADTQQELHNEGLGLLSGTGTDVVMLEAKGQLHNNEPGMQSVAGPDAVMTKVYEGNDVSAAAEAAVAAGAGSKQLACEGEWSEAAAGTGSALPPTEAAALAESASEQMPREEGLAEDTAATFAAQPLAGCTLAPRQLGQAAAIQPGSEGPVQEQAAGCEQPICSSDQMASCSNPGLEGAAQEQEAGCGRPAAQEQEAVFEQSAAQQQEAGCGQAPAWEQEHLAEQAAAQEQEAGCGQPAAQEQEVPCAPAPPPEQQPDCSQAEGQSLPGRARRYTRRMTRAAATAGSAADSVHAVPQGAKQQIRHAAMAAGGAAAAGGWHMLQGVMEEPKVLQPQAAQKQQQAIEGHAAAGAVQHQVAPAAARRRSSRAAVASGSTSARAAPASSRQLMLGIAEEPEAHEANAMLQRQPAHQVCARQILDATGAQS